MKNADLKKSIMSIALKAAAGIAVIGVLLGVIYFLSGNEKKGGAGGESATDKNGEPLIDVYSAEGRELKSISVITAGESYTLLSGKDGWKMEGLEKVPLSENLAETLASSVESIASPMLVSENGEKLAEYGLEPPKYTLKLSYDDREDTLLVGDQSGEYFYFKKADDKKVYIVSYDTFYLLLSGKNGFLNKIVWSVNQDNIVKVKFGDTVIQRDGESWMELSPYNMPADTQAVTTRVIAPLATLKADEVFGPGELEFEPETTVTVTTKEDERSLLLQKESASTYLVSTDSSDYVYRVPTVSLTFLNVKGFDIISRYIAPISITEIKKIEFESPDGKTVLSIDAPSSEAPVFYKDGVEADETNFRDFYQELMTLSFNEEGVGAGNAERTVTFTKESGSVIKIEFIPASEGDYAVRINGSANFIIRQKPVKDVFAYLKNIKAAY